ncbi:hypothetical protein [Paraburkholderia elongata]|uniref:Uncharacterized protein n=1 Tax=Paraburkholderia elongata TaxID=2675747 RepID=A0A972NM19_9BURK|nr:hypothetical protein [Paraburkholderia elongata]NPT55983.1 hypothetical protein [Paraburkholderia elongata]
MFATYLLDDDYYAPMDCSLDNGTETATSPYQLLLQEPKATLMRSTDENPQSAHVAVPGNN